MRASSSPRMGANFNKTVSAIASAPFRRGPNDASGSGWSWYCSAPFRHSIVGGGGVSGGSAVDRRALARARLLAASAYPCLPALRWFFACAQDAAHGFAGALSLSALPDVFRAWPDRWRLALEVKRNPGSHRHQDPLVALMRSSSRYPCCRRRFPIAAICFNPASRDSTHRRRWPPRWEPIPPQHWSSVQSPNRSQTKATL